MKKYWMGLILGAFLLALGSSCNLQNKQKEMAIQEKSEPKNVKLFLSGDVMTGRGIDQALPHSVDPVLYESYVKDARNYVLLAERENGNIATPVSFDHIWGDAIEVWNKNSPDLKLINLETSITTNDEPWPGKGIHYRMHPENVDVLIVAGIDYCSLGNNHVLDWGRPGLKETMETLEAVNIAFSGAGENEKQAAAPSVLETEKGRILIFSYGTPSSGVPGMWAAEPGLSGVNFLPDFNEKEIRTIRSEVKSVKKAGDVVILSIHWGGNWGYTVSDRQKEFAHQLIDEAGVDVVFGHSSHHPMGMEVYNEKLIIYGAGDFINDYEGISGHSEYRGELALMYFPQIDINNGHLVSLKMVPMEIRKFRLNNASTKDAKWLQETLDREGEKLGTGIRRENDNSLWLEW